MTHERLRLPAEIEAKMRFWREGLIPLPEEYIRWHEEQAGRAIIPEFDANYIIHRKFLIDDGWCDGMKFVCLIIEHRSSGSLYKVKWSDCQHWYVLCSSGGWALFDPQKPEKPSIG